MKKKKMNRSLLQLSVYKGTPRSLFFLNDSKVLGMEFICGGYYVCRRRHAREWKLL
jgi:hypothetical protein